MERHPELAGALQYLQNEDVREVFIDDVRTYLKDHIADPTLPTALGRNVNAWWTITGVILEQPTLFTPELVNCFNEFLTNQQTRQHDEKLSKLLADYIGTWMKIPGLPAKIFSIAELCLPQFIQAFNEYLYNNRADVTTGAILAESVDAWMKQASLVQQIVAIPELFRPVLSEALRIHLTSHRPDDVVLALFEMEQDFWAHNRFLSGVIRKLVTVQEPVQNALPENSNQKPGSRRQHHQNQPNAVDTVTTFTQTNPTSAAKPSKRAQNAAQHAHQPPLPPRPNPPIPVEGTSRVMNPSPLNKIDRVYFLWDIENCSVSNAFEAAYVVEELLGRYAHNIDPLPNKVQGIVVANFENRGQHAISDQVTSALQQKAWVLLHSSNRAFGGNVVADDGINKQMENYASEACEFKCPTRLVLISGDKDFAIKCNGLRHGPFRLYLEIVIVYRSDSDPNLLLSANSVDLWDNILKSAANRGQGVGQIAGKLTETVVVISFTQLQYLCRRSTFVARLQEALRRRCNDNSLQLIVRPTQMSLQAQTVEGSGKAVAAFSQVLSAHLCSRKSSKSVSKDDFKDRIKKAVIRFAQQLNIAFEVGYVTRRNQPLVLVEVVTESAQDTERLIDFVDSLSY